MDWRARLGLFAAALWWGSLTAIGAWAVPLLFVHLPTPALAGQTAARLFTAQTWVALGCGAVLMAVARQSAVHEEREERDASPMAWANGALAWVVAGVLLALLSEFAVAPRIVARENLRLWHSLGSAMFALQWVCAGAALWKLAGAGRAGDAGPQGPA